ncbi:two-component response regulator 24-like [Pistacia vera]|uniref:two-component response regulator 24-like n=1 Tax=Pistacia vera TaxID=55513 RepID=UPI00126306F6|nr:two-component response regulator 24-like [Pistacia vera]
MEFEEDSTASKRMKIAENEDPITTKVQFSALIVDDDPLIRKIHSEVLKSLGFQTQVAKSGKEAVDLYRAGANFDIVFMDMQMPVMNGIEATRAARDGVSTKIVGVSSECSESEIEAFILAGLDLYYAKPLTDAIRSFLSSKISK